MPVMPGEYSVSLSMISREDVTELVTEVPFKAESMNLATLATKDKAAVSAFNAKASDLAGTMKGTAFGFFQFIMGIVGLAGGIIAGILWNISPSTMFTYMDVVSLISIILLLFVKDGF